jgi:16S rRNA (adenine1518-N6/adenine1519-N6)-dimethyltransferase
MVQREVAERICAPAGQMSLLSVSVQYYATPEILFYVDKKSFWPVPEVDSAIIKIVPDGKTPDKKTTVNFFRTVKAGFCAKRKTLSNNLTSSFQLDKKTIEEKIKKAGLVPTQRAQELNIADWKKLANLMSD